MNSTTKDQVDRIIRSAKNNRSGGYRYYSQLKRELELLPLSSREYEDAIIKIARELRI